MSCPSQLLINPISTVSTCPKAFNKVAEEKTPVIDEILFKDYFSSQKSSMAGKERAPFEEGESAVITVKHPIALMYDEKMGRCLVAARDIEPGEIFLNDWPLVTAPNAGKSATTCLACSLIVPDLQPCPKCEWPVCNPKCSNISQHADFECKIFSRENIKPDLPAPYCYIASAEYIKILRCLLLKDENDPEKMTKWKQVLSLEAHMGIRRNMPRVQLMSGLIKRFVKRFCKLREYDDATIEYVLGVVDVNAFRHSFAPAPLKPSQKNPETDESKRNATFLYPVASMAAHGCVRNTDWKTLAGGQLEMRASHKIFKGDIICHAYVDLMLGTPERRRLLHKDFFFDCSCLRCQSPTEMNTFFSALKCTECSSGYMLAEDPLMYKATWICNQAGCNGSKSYQYERELVKQLLGEENKICEEIPQNTNLTTVRSITKVLKQHRDVTLHPNHYRIVSLEYLLVRQLLKIPKPPVEIMLEMRRLIKKYIRLSSVFHPCDEED